MLLAIGSLAPDFNLPDESGKFNTLKEYSGKWLVIYFYPKDNTPGCTLEACSFRDNSDKLQSQGICVIGISKDPVKSHLNFHNKFKLNFPILSNESHSIIEEYGAWGLKKFLGKDYMGVRRISFLINPKGKIVKIYEKVNPISHVAEILTDFQKILSTELL
jgi:thioredoxin-dependent peroxiredoxin